MKFLPKNYREFEPQVVADRKVPCDRDAFSLKKVPKDIEYIVVGSGIGGLYTAAGLARVGRKVLVLEQHYVAGGCQHVFENNGFEFDTGIHYLGHEKRTRFFMDILTMPGEEVDFAKLGTKEDGYVYDTIRVGEDVRFDMRMGEENFQADLIKMFPQEEGAIRKYIKLCFDTLKDGSWTNSKMFSAWLRPVYWMMKGGAAIKYRNYTTEHVIRNICGVKDDLLYSILCGQYLDYGPVPSESNWVSHATITAYYMKGGIYPVKGTSALVKALIPTIEAAGGRVLVKAPVTKILFEDDTAVGVQIKGEYELRAKCGVISAAGAQPTLNMMKEEHLKQSIPWAPDVTRQYHDQAPKGGVRQGMVCALVFLGLEGTMEEMDIVSANQWYLPVHEGDGVVGFDERMREIEHSGPEIMKTIEPAMFLCFPSAKDPAHIAKHPNKHTCVIALEVAEEWFEKFKNIGGPGKKKNPEYDQLKKLILDVGLARMYKFYPKTEGRVVYTDVSTPLSMDHYLGRAGPYGLANDVGRYSDAAWKILPRVQGVKNLWLSGHDTSPSGWQGAMCGGFLVLMDILDYTFKDVVWDGRHIIRDLANLPKLPSRKELLAKLPQNTNAGNKAKPKAAKSEGDVEMTICFGSQSGTAEAFAQDLAAEAQQFGFTANVIDLDEYEHDDLSNEQFVTFLMATFGEGDPTDNAVTFCDWIHENNRPRDLAKETSFAVFALGDRNYEHFCNVGRELDARLAKLSGKRVVEHGEGDDDGNIEEDFEKWKQLLWPAARKHFGMTGPLPVFEVPPFKPEWEYTEVLDSAEAYDSESAILSDPKSYNFYVPVKKVQELRQDLSDGGSTVHVELDISGPDLLQYRTADNLGILCQNDEKQVLELCSRLGTSPSTLFAFSRLDGSKNQFLYPSPCSMKDAFMSFIDFNNPPRTKVLKLLAQYANTEDAKELNALCGEKKEDCIKDQRSLYEFLMDFTSIKVPINHFLEFAPRLKPRYYTISSSSKADPNTVSVTSSLLFGPKPRGRHFKGVCTHHLHRLKEGRDRLCVLVRDSTFRLPKDIANTPVIMVGPGTGLAPFRGFVQEFTHLKKTQGISVDSTLYFGCKKSSQDYIYDTELEKAAADGVLTNLRLAFSREQAKKVYVQDLLAQHGKETWDKVANHNAHIYVCGATDMGRAIREAVVQIAQDVGGLSQVDAVAYLQDMQKNGRYIQELWA